MQGKCLLRIATPKTSSGMASMATVNTRLSTTISANTGQIARAAVFATGSTIRPVMLAITSTPEIARISEVNWAHQWNGLPAGRGLRVAQRAPQTTPPPG